MPHACGSEPPSLPSRSPACRATPPPPSLPMAAPPRIRRAPCWPRLGASRGASSPRSSCRRRRSTASSTGTAPPQRQASPARARRRAPAPRWRRAKRAS
eukprot:scaffold24645_cov71-Phaeocystis_antarctica.AAC.1